MRNEVENKTPVCSYSDHARLVFFDEINAVKYMICHVISKIIMGDD